jgi:thymidylate kinase
MKIAIEGMDGVGKSTVAQAIAKRKGFKYLEKPLQYFFEGSINELMQFSSRLYDIDDPVIKAWFFGMGNLFAFRHYKDEDLIIDRHFASNYFWNGTEESKAVFKTMKEIIGVPDITILLYASPKTRMQRLYERDPKDRDIFDPEKKVNGYDKMVTFLNEFEIPYVLVNTEGKNVDQVIDEVDEIVTGLQIPNDKVLKLEKKQC